MVKTVNDAVLDLSAELRAHGVSGSRLEARELVAYALKIPPQELYQRRGQYIFDEELDEIRRLKAVRLGGVPLPHIIGQWDFYGLTFEVTADTLIPRPDTETLVECGVEFLRGRARGRLLDLCCGTGCVGIAALKNLPIEMSGLLADLSEPALRVARRNLTRHGVGGRAATSHLDALKPFSPALGKFSAYFVQSALYSERAKLTASTSRSARASRAWRSTAEPTAWIFYRAVARNAREVLTSGGALMFEVGLGQSGDVMDILQVQGYADVRCARDLSGIERVVIGCGLRAENQ